MSWKEATTPDAMLPPSPPSAQREPHNAPFTQNGPLDPKHGASYVKKTPTGGKKTPTGGRGRPSVHSVHGM